MDLRQLLNNIFYTIFICSVISCSTAESSSDDQALETAQEAAEEPYTQEGVASYYARSLRGSKMANGEPYKPTAMTAAHRKLPLGTKVQVTNTQNDSSAIVEITDRGPYVGRRIIDLSRAAALTLDFVGEGKTVVELEVIEPAEGYTVSDSVSRKQTGNR
jgi:rare lipoprotein A